MPYSMGSNPLKRSRIFAQKFGARMELNDEAKTGQGHRAFNPGTRVQIPVGAWNSTVITVDSYWRIRCWNLAIEPNLTFREKSNTRRREADGNSLPAATAFPAA